MARELDLSEMLELELTKDQYTKEQLRVKGEEDRKTEELKARHACELEELKAKNASKLEAKKILGTIGKVVVGAGIWFGLTCLADRIEVPRRNVRMPKD